MEKLYSHFGTVDSSAEFTIATYATLNSTRCTSSSHAHCILYVVLLTMLTCKNTIRKSSCFRNTKVFHALLLFTCVNVQFIYVSMQLLSIVLYTIVGIKSDAYCMNLLTSCWTWNTVNCEVRIWLIFCELLVLCIVGQKSIFMSSFRLPWNSLFALSMIGCNGNKIADALTLQWYRVNHSSVSAFSICVRNFKINTTWKLRLLTFIP